jgi:hypothetical protein
LEAWPQLVGEAVNLCKLYNAVKRHGGIKKGCVRSVEKGFEHCQ